MLLLLLLCRQIGLLITFTYYDCRRGLLTRRQLTTGPEFGITLGPASYLDGFGHVVFGIILEGLEVRKCRDKID